LKDILKLTLYQAVYYVLRFIPAGKGHRHLLVVKTDEIGDYVLARNLLPLFRNSEPYRGYKITFVGNIAFRQLFGLYDRETADETIWLDKKKFRSNLIYRWRFLLKIRRLPVSDVVSLVYSRIWRKDDVIIALSGASNKTGMLHNTLVTDLERRLTPHSVYTRLEDSGEETLFDALRNARFVQKILRLPPQSVSTAIDVRMTIDGFSLPRNYFIVFPGSGLPEKKWPPEAFAAVARHIAGVYGLFPVLCGSPADLPDCEAFVHEYDAPVVNLAGKTTLPQLLAIFKNAGCLISVDTGSVHLAAAVGCPVFGLFSGLHYGRFAPYPREIASQFYPIYPESFERLREKDGPPDYEAIPFSLLREITPGQVIAIVDLHLPAIINFKQNSREGIT
jgi:ADP-heptose:LPS heptosyltransferase